MNYSRKKILMVYPEFPKNTYWSFSYALPFIGKKSAMPPLGIITVAAMLPDNYDIKLVDMNIEDLKDDDIRQADAVFTSSMIVQKASLEKVIYRANMFKIPVVAGGPLPTQYYDQIKGVDHFIIGESESGALESFLKDFENGNAKKAYARMTFRKRPEEKAIDENEFYSLQNYFKNDCDIKVSDSRPNMNLSPVPRFDLLKIKDYGSMSIQYSRGCPHSCEFCNEHTLFGHEMRLKPSAKFIKELDDLYKLGYRGSVFFVDDNFIGNMVQVKKDLMYLRKFQEEKNYPFSFYTEATILLAKDEELMRLMRDAGFNMVFVGIESLDKKVLKSMNKIQNVNSDLLSDVRTIQKYGMEVTGGFIVGNDNEPDDICDRIFDFCQEAGIATAMVGMLTVLKGSNLYERLKKEGRLLNDSGGDNTHSFDLNFVTLNDRKKVVNDYKNLLSRLYDSDGKNYFERCSRLLDNLGYNPKGSRKMGTAEINAVLMSLRKQSFRPSYRKFILHSLVRHTGMFPESVRLAIQGYHHKKITKCALKAHELQIYLTNTYNRLSASVKTKVSESEDWVHKVQEDANKFLKKTKKKIQRLPEDYRPKLTSSYNKLRAHINKYMSKENPASAED